MPEDEKTQEPGLKGIAKLPWQKRFKAWWNFPGFIGLVSAVVGLLHYTPFPLLDFPRLANLHADIAPELIGIGLTLILIDWAVEKRQQDELKAQLIRQMGSRHNEVADTAVRELAHHGWLYDGSLTGAILYKANLISVEFPENAVLSGACFERAELNKAQLVRVYMDSAILVHANLTGASLQYANMKNAALHGAILNCALVGDANLRGADLVNANMSHCTLSNGILIDADVRDADFSEVDMRGANLTGIKNWTIDQLRKAKATKLSQTIMPDGTRLGRIVLDRVETAGSPTFDEWKTSYLATHGGTETDLRDPR